MVILDNNNNNLESPSSGGQANGPEPVAVAHANEVVPTAADASSDKIISDEQPATSSNTLPGQPLISNQELAVRVDEQRSDTVDLLLISDQAPNKIDTCYNEPTTSHQHEAAFVAPQEAHLAASWPPALPAGYSAYQSLPDMDQSAGQPIYANEHDSYQANYQYHHQPHHQQQPQPQPQQPECAPYQHQQPFEQAPYQQYEQQQQQMLADDLYWTDAIYESAGHYNSHAFAPTDHQDHYYQFNASQPMHNNQQQHYAQPQPEPEYVQLTSQPATAPPVDACLPETVAALNDRSGQQQQQSMWPDDERATESSQTLLPLQNWTASFANNESESNQQQQQQSQRTVIRRQNTCKSMDADANQEQQHHFEQLQATKSSRRSRAHLSKRRKQSASPTDPLSSLAAGWSSPRSTHSQENDDEDDDNSSLSRSELSQQSEWVCQATKTQQAGSASSSSGLLCQATFDSLDAFVGHLEEEHVKQDSERRGHYFCRWFGCKRSESFNARYKLLVHMRVHSGEKPFECKSSADCKKRFSRLENLKIHVRSHTGEKPYSCNYANCTKSFTNSSDRIKHHKTHDNPKPYPCPEKGCDKRYTDPSSLRKHQKSHKRELLRPSEQQPAQMALDYPASQHFEQQPGYHSANNRLQYELEQRPVHQANQFQQQQQQPISCPADYDPNCILQDEQQQQHSYQQQYADHSYEAHLSQIDTQLSQTWAGPPTFHQATYCGQALGAFNEPPHLQHEAPAYEYSQQQQPNQPQAEYMEHSVQEHYASNEPHLHQQLMRSLPPNANRYDGRQ